MSDAEQVWLVDREFTDKGLVTTVYATTDGDRKLVEQFSTNSPREVTAAKTVEAEKLVESDSDERDRYAEEAERMAERHDPDEEV